MTIGIDASRANRDFKTGTEWYSYYLITNLVKIDKENKYILYSDKPLNRAFLNDLDLDNNKNVKVKVLEWPFKYFWTMGRLSLEMIFRRPDVLFVPAHSLPLFFPKKTINTIHDIAFISNQSIYGQEVLSSSSNRVDKFLRFLVKIFTLGRYNFKSIDYLKWSTKFALKRARKIITVSHFTKNDILKNYKKVKVDKIKVVYNGFPNNIYHLISDEASMNNVLRRYGIEEPFLLYIGRMERKKNIYNLIEGFAYFKENNKDSREKLVLIGSAGFGYDEMRYMIEELCLENDVIILGWVDEVDLPFIFNKAQIFIFPSLYEGFGIPVLQAMACGAPVLLSNIEVLQEVAQDNALFFDRFDPIDLSEKISNILNNEDLRRELISKGLSHSKNFSWEKCARETLAEINSL
ncbi:MAG: glycosyltransferase family 1 protein [Patescibacteria group bacterium]|nr:glycosyltransferase family 1 protein [Patescibacteria group bacterium]